MRIAIMAATLIVLSASLGFVFAGDWVGQALAGIGMALSAVPLVVGLAWLASTAQARQLAGDET